MKKPNLKNLTHWVLAAVFLVLVAGFSLLDQPNATAQSLTPSVSTQSTETPIISPALPTESVTANIRRLLETKECVGCNLIGAHLKGANLQAANLEGANLQGADLEKANLQSTNLLAANLQGADLGKANIARANLQRANLFDADLEKANLTDANIEGANLQGADLEGVIRPQGLITQ